MHTDVVTAPEDMDQEALSQLFAEHDFLAIPVLDAQRRVKGIVTADDILDVVQEEATEDIQKFGGMEALERAVPRSRFSATW
jgi:magnesium transporter